MSNLNELLKKMKITNELLTDKACSDINKHKSFYISNKHRKNYNIKHYNNIEPITTHHNFFKNFKDIHKNDIGFILGSGPSINNYNIKKLIEKIKKENPNKNIIGCGGNKIFLKKEILPI